MAIEENLTLPVTTSGNRYDSEVRSDAAPHLTLESAFEIIEQVWNRVGGLIDVRSWAEAQGGTSILLLLLYRAQLFFQEVRKMSVRTQDKLVEIQSLPRGIYAVLGRDDKLVVIAPIVNPTRKFGVSLTILSSAGVIGNNKIPSRLELSTEGIWGVAPPGDPAKLFPGHTIKDGHTHGVLPPEPLGQALELSEADLEILRSASSSN
jgi:hypothetical protein